MCHLIKGTSPRATTRGLATKTSVHRLVATAAALSALSLTACGSDGTSQPTPTAQPGALVTWAGTGAQGHDTGSHNRLECWLNQPMEFAFVGDGSAVIVDWNNHCVRRVDDKGNVNDIIGTQLPGDWPCQDPTMASDPAACAVPLDGTVKASDLSLNHPMDVVVDADGSFFLAAWHNHKVEHFDPATDMVTIVAGQQKPGPGGDGGPASAALLNFPSSLARQSDGGLLVSDERTNRIRRIAPDNTIMTVAGVPPPPPMGMNPNPGVTDDGVPATQAALALTTSDKISGSDNPPPGGAIALGSDGTLFIADTSHHCIRSVAPGADGVVGTGAPEEELITTVAGTCGTKGYAGDGGAATAALLNPPFDLEIGPKDGALYVADTENHVVRKVDLKTGDIHPVAGTGQPGYSGDTSPAAESKLREPYGLAFDAKGVLYIVDTGNNRIREILP